MNEDDNLQRSRMRDIATFDAENAGAFPASGPMRETLDELGQIASDLDALAPSQESAEAYGRAQTALLNARLDAVHEDLVDLSQIQRALLPDHPELRGLFALPTNERQESWLDAAAAVPAKLTPHLSLFESYGLPADFLADLAADVAALQEARNARTGFDQSRSGDTAAIAAKIERNIELVNKLKAFGKIRFRGNIELQHKWETASELGKGHRAHRKKTPAV